MFFLENNGRIMMLYRRMHSGTAFKNNFLFWLDLVRPIFYPNNCYSAGHPSDSCYVFSSSPCFIFWWKCTHAVDMSYFHFIFTYLGQSASPCRGIFPPRHKRSRNSGEIKNVSVDNQTRFPSISKGWWFNLWVQTHWRGIFLHVPLELTFFGRLHKSSSRSI